MQGTCTVAHPVQNLRDIRHYIEYSLLTNNHYVNTNNTTTSRVHILKKLRDKIPACIYYGLGRRYWLPVQIYHSTDTV
jgi:hypothetical protein